ncbi:hypothetical protein BSKO_10467 [Bryopsis sp. KO-2023]|nr:hypothetical protein BSKO_10467 [Bryopsis sp. KO-2023]
MSLGACSLCSTGGAFVQRPAPLPCCRHSLLEHTFQPKKLECRASENEAESDVDARNERRIAGLKMDAQLDKPLSRSSMIKWGVMSVLGTGCACCLGTPTAKAAAWGYDYENGPTTWGGVCSSGEAQSPVDIRATQIIKHPVQGQFSFNYKVETNAKVFNTGHGTMQMNFPPGQTCKLRDNEYELVQVHFHTPSEHSMDGKRTAMEVHLVHKNKKTGGLAVLGSFMTVSPFSNAPLATALSQAPKEGPKKTTPILMKEAIDLMKLVPPQAQDGNRPFIHYMGSLTTPPCSEAVEWYVFRDPVTVSPYQVLGFEAFLSEGNSFGRNSRPLQALKTRGFDFFVF